jgi:phage terminase small subunit
MRQLQPPKDFSPDARDIWAAAQRQLRAQGTWERTDAALLEMYCRNVLAARAARADADNLRYGDAMMMRAALKQAADSEAAALAIARALLLTPEARRRAGVKPPSANGAADELAALIR